MKRILFYLKFIGLLVLMAGYAPVQPDYEVVPDFRGIKDPVRRRYLFFDFMRPVVEKENKRILKQRKRFSAIRQYWIREGEFGFWETRWLKDICREYKVDCAELDSEPGWETLRRRIDLIPIRMALAQSASESAWGMSRFVVQGNAMFGQWTYSKASGMVPKDRKPGEKHRVAEFESVKYSVRAYMRNLNTHWAYKEFRINRLEQRSNGLEPDGYTLADHLLRYSIRREVYVEEIKEIIVRNRSFMRIK
ncbi:MAG: Bax protein [Proteobacteria bacterium]|nr:Bax protein [Pseudomonadota bacterium]